MQRVLAAPDHVYADHAFQIVQPPTAAAADYQGTVPGPTSAAAAAGAVCPVQDLRLLLKVSDELAWAGF